MDISAFGAFFLFLYPFWPAIVAACFAALRRNRQEGFFLISVVIGYVAFVIGATGWTKILPFEKMVELCDKINKPIVLVGGKEDFENGDKLEKFFNSPTNDLEVDDVLKKLNKKAVIFNGCGKFNLSQSASLVHQAQVVFGHDTGLTHIAAAFKKTIFSIFF